MKKIVYLCLMAMVLSAGEVQIQADRFEANQQRFFTQFIGHVILTKGKNVIKADRVYIYFNKAKKPIKIDAVGHVTFKIYDKKGKYYEGKAGKIVYFPKKKEYLLSKNVQVVQYPDQKKIYAQLVVIDLIASKIEVKGNENKPVKMILKIEEQ